MQALVQPVGHLHAAVTCSATLVPTCATLPPVITDNDCKTHRRYITGTKISSKGRVKRRSQVSDQGGDDYPWLGWFEIGFGSPPWQGGQPGWGGAGGSGEGGNGGWGGAGGGDGDEGGDSDSFRRWGRPHHAWSVGAWHAVCVASLANTAVFATQTFHQDCCC